MQFILFHQIASCSAIVLTVNLLAGTEIWNVNPLLLDRTYCVGLLPGSCNPCDSSIYNDLSRSLRCLSEQLLIKLFLHFKAKHCCDLQDIRIPYALAVQAQYSVTHYQRTGPVKTTQTFARGSSDLPRRFTAHLSRMCGHPDEKKTHFGCKRSGFFRKIRHEFFRISKQFHTSLQQLSKI